MKKLKDANMGIEEMNEKEIIKLLRKTNWGDYQARVNQQVAEKAEEYRLSRVRSYESITGIPCFD